MLKTHNKVISKNNQERCPEQYCIRKGASSSSKGCHHTKLLRSEDPREVPLLYQLAAIPYVPTHGKGNGVSHHQRARKSRMHHVMCLKVMHKPPIMIMTWKDWSWVRRLHGMGDPIETMIKACQDGYCHAKCATWGHQVSCQKSPDK